jgi:hypothetical protein
MNLPPPSLSISFFCSFVSPSFSDFLVCFYTLPLSFFSSSLLCNRNLMKLYFVHIIIYASFYFYIGCLSVCLCLSVSVKEASLSQSARTISLFWTSVEMILTWSARLIKTLLILHFMTSLSAKFLDISSLLCLFN